MITGAIGCRLLRLAGALALAGMTVGCATAPRSTVAPADFGKDPISRAARLTRYCDRLADKGEAITALGLCARAYEVNPDDPEPLMKTASILESLNRKQAAAEAYKKLLEHHPDDHEAQYKLGKIYLAIGEPDLAALQFNHAIRSDPKDPRPYNALGILRDQAGEHEAAQALYREALKRDPKSFSVRNNLGLSLALSGQRDQAVEMLAELAVDPEAGETVLRNLEAAYASRTPSDAAPPAAMPPAAAVPAKPPAELPAEPNAIAVPPVEPVKTEALEAPPQNSAPAKAPTGNTGPIPLMPAPAVPAQSGPMQLYVPRPHAAADGEQSKAEQAGPSTSVILSAAARLMEPPAWASFEPGVLLGSLPPTKPAAPAEASPTNNDAGEFGVDNVDIGDTLRPGADGLSLLSVSGGKPSA